MNNFYFYRFLVFHYRWIQQGGVPSNDAIIGQVTEDSAAQVAGLKEGDKVLSIDGVEIHSWDEMTKVVRSSADKTLAVSIERDGKTQEVQVTPKAVEASDGLKVGQFGVTRILKNDILSILLMDLRNCFSGRIQCSQHQARCLHVGLI